MAYPTVRQVGILLVVAGIILLAFSVRPKRRCQSGPPAEVGAKPRGSGIVPAGTGSVSTIGDRYVVDAGGSPRFLIGYYRWSSIDNASLIDHPNSYATMMGTGSDYGINYIRVSLGINRFTATTSPASYDGTTTRTPWVYTGSPAKADLSTWDSTFWDSLKAMAVNARSKGILLHVSIFDAVDIRDGSKAYRWVNSFWNVNNQTSSFYGNLDTDSDGNADESGEFYNTSAFNTGTGVGYYQKALIDKATAELSSYENVFFELGNETGAGSTAWHDAAISYIRAKTDKLVTVNTCDLYLLCTAVTSPGMWSQHVAASPSEVRTNVASIVGDGWPAMEDPDGPTLGVDGHDANDLRKAAWYSFAGGAAGWGGFTGDWNSGARTSTVLTYYKNLQDFISTTGVRFWDMTPQHASISDSASNSLLANPGVEYVAYVLSSSSVTIALSSGNYNVRYFNPITGVFTEGGRIGGGSRTSNRPAGASDWVVYLSAIPPAPRTSSP